VETFAKPSIRHRLTNCLRYVLLIPFSCLPAGNAQTLPERSLLEDYALRHWDHLRGLPESVITGLTFDQAGFLWISSTSQLMRFDGVDFTTWPKDAWPGKPPVLLNHLASDTAGNLWVSGMNGVMRLGPSGDKSWSSLDNDDTPTETLSTFHQKDGSVHVRLRRTDTPSSLSPRILSGDLWQPPQAQLLHPDPLWNHLDPDCWRSAIFLGQPPSPPLSARGERGVFLADHLGTPAIFTQEAAYLYGGSEWSAMRNPHGISNRPFPASFFYHNKMLWTGGAEGVFASSPTHVYRITGREGNAPVDNRSLIEDSGGNVWAGGGTGLFRFQKKIAANLSPPEPETRFSALYRSPSSRVLAGTESGAIHDISNGTPFEIAHIEGSVSALAEGANGELWIGTRGNHLLRVDPQGTQAIMTPPESLRTSRVILSLHLDRKNRLWAGCVDGLLLLDSNRRLSAIEGIPPAFDRLDPVTCITESPDGTLWFGFQRGGLGMMSPDGISTFITESEGLPSNSILALHVDSSKRLWVSTLAGLAFLEDGLIQKVDPIPALSGEPVLQIISDVRHLWTGTPDGLFRIKLPDPKTPHSQPLSKGVLRITTNSGLASNECLGGSGHLATLLPDGRPAFLTQNGIASIRSDAPEDSQPSKPRIEAVRTASQSLRPHSPLTGITEDLSLNPETDWVEIQYTAPDLVHLNETVFRYRTLPGDEDWSPPTTGRKHVLKSLPPGAYRFEVQSGTPSGIWHPVSAVARFSIARPVSQSPVFWAAIAALSASLVVACFKAIVRMRLARLLSRERLINEERQRISRDLHDEIGAKLTRIGLLSSLCKNGPEDRRETRLYELESGVAQIQRAFQETLWTINPRHDSASGLAHFACKYLEDFLEGSNIRPKTEIGQDLESIPLSPTFRRESLLIIKQAISNAIEHAAPHFISLTFSRTKETLSITLSDDGAGFKAGLTEREASGLGEGIRGMASRCSSLDGVFSLSSQPGNGTIISLTWKLPLKN
jgi:signal transduction histidine kinase/ligand-binding sensor domain-containing protein